MPVRPALGPGAAIALLGALLASAGCEPADPLAAARELQTQGDYAGSLELLSERIRENPLDPETNFLYGRALVSTGQPTLASWSLRNAMEDPEWLEPAALQLARAALGTGDFNEAVEACTRMLESHPEHPVALLLRAQARAHWRNDLEAALADAELALELDPDLIEAYEPKILALLALERHEEATEALAVAGERLREMEAAESTLAWHCSTTAIFSQDVGDVEAARKKWEECLERYPDDPLVVGKGASFFEGLGEWQRSVEVLQAAYEESPVALFRVSLADRLRVLGRAAEGEKLLREATESDDPREAAAAWSDLAVFRHSLREHGAAADALGRAVAIMREGESPHPQLLFRYADALLVADRLDEASTAAEELTVPAQQALIRARIAQERGQPAAALELFDEALRLWPNNASARYYAALAAEQLGDFDRALEEYRYSIRVSAKATDARTRAARLLLALGQPLQAYQLLFLQVESAPLESEGELLSMYLMAVVANPKQLQSSLLELQSRNPEQFPAALARGAEGAAERGGPAAALSLLVGAPGVDYADPGSAPALRAAVRHAHAAGRPELAAGLVEAALAAHPESGVSHEIQGLHLELGGAAAGAAEAAYRRALELAPRNDHALAGLARALVESDPGESLSLLDRAAALDPSETSYPLAAARILRAAAKTEQAAQRLEALLRSHPLDRNATLELASLDLERDTATPRTVELARRAVKLRGGAEALDLLSRAHAQLDQPEEAAAAAARAARIRERAAVDDPADDSPEDPAADPSDEPEASAG